MLDSLSVLLSWVISHLQENGFHVGKPKRFLARSLAFSEDVKLSQCNLIPLEPVFFSEVRLHVLDEGASYFGREIKRLTDYHVRSDVAAAAQICLPLRAQPIRLFQSYLLSQHDIAGHQIAFWYEAVAHYRTADFVEFFYVRHVRVVDAIPPGRMASDDIEKVTRIKLRQLPL
jgi:hypothetical protein